MKYIDNEAKVFMVQVFKHRWQIETSRGFVILGDITISNPLEAEIFIRNYISSFNCWTYEVVPLEKREK